ncbi:MerR family transcriptional regulator [Cytobacillus sp.]|uniref:MerR family transcriptional regulator n=1 Tax=Cytobacillus sp. TaxID=2675269 RepID=UPI0028BDADEB|nr:MerR family transcriptional regulator [Cytobacillus sp.]
MIHINKVRDLTGVTVRTLRYYDEIGLIRPASKTEGGHRLYTNEEIKKLQQVQFLKKVGFTLDEIKNMLASPDWDWSKSLKRQLSYVKNEQENLKKTERALIEMIHGIAIEGDDEWQAIYKIMRLSSNDKESQKSFRESLFKGKNKELLEKVPSMTSENSDALEWIALLGQLKRYMKNGPEASKVQNIIRRMDEKRIEEFDGEDEFLSKLWKVRMSSEQSEKFGLYPIDEDVLKFLEQAYAIYLKKGIAIRE